MAEVDVPGESAPDRESLNQDEQNAFDLMLERGFEDVNTERSNVVRNKLREYRDEIMHGAEIARAQFDQRFGGMQAPSGKFVASRIRSGYFGYDSWEGNLTSLTAGGTATWINDGAPDNLGGTDTSMGNPLKIGEEAVHVIVGIGTYSASPKLEAFDYEVNESPRSVINVKYEWTRTDVAIKWLDRALILPENTLFEMQPYVDVGGDDAPYLVGVSFIEDRASQLVDPANMTDDSTSTQDNIVAQG